MRGPALVALGLIALPAAARAQALDLSHGGPVTVTALGGIDWDQKAQTVTAYDQARAVRGVVTVDADRLIAFYRKKAGAAGTAAPAATSVSAPGTLPAAATGPVATSAGTTSAGTTSAGTTSLASTSAGTTSAGPTSGATPGLGPDPDGANEIYRLQAVGHVHIYTATDQSWGDQGVYDIDQAVLVLTGHALKLVTPSDTITARDSLEYHPPTHVSVARGDAVLVTNDGRRIAADVLVGYSVPDSQPGAAKGASAAPPPAAKPGADPLTSSGKLKKAEAYGNVVVRTQTETVVGDRGVYVTDTGIARIMGNVHITRGQNQLNGRSAIVNMHTGLATMTEDPGSRVQGLIVPNDNTAAAPAKPGAKPAGASLPPVAARRS